MPNRKQSIARWVLALFFIVAGVNHFLAPEIYLGMMPAWLPFKDAANLISGIAEIAGGIGLLLPRFRRPAAWGLIALLVAIFPANIQVALQGNMPGLENAPPALLWLRLLFQPVFIAWVWWTGLARDKTSAPSPR
jgi:uncharacterized membrane protein